MFRIGGHESGDSPAAPEREESMELDHFFLVLVAAEDKQGFSVFPFVFADFDTLTLGYTCNVLVNVICQ